MWFSRSPDPRVLKANAVSAGPGSPRNPSLFQGTQPGPLPLKKATHFQVDLSHLWALVQRHARQGFLLFQCHLINIYYSGELTGEVSELVSPSLVIASCLPSLKASQRSCCHSLWWVWAGCGLWLSVSFPTSGRGPGTLTSTPSS